MSTGGVVDLPITGNVDPQFIEALTVLNAVMAAQAQHLETAGQKAEASKGHFTQFADSVNEIRTAVTTVVADVARLVEGFVALVDEQQRLDDASQALGLDFDRAAEAAGRFTDETETMRAGQRFAASDIRLTQTELDALARVAGAKSREMGVSTSEAVNMLTESLIRGREAGLQRFGTALAEVAGGSHTVGERLQVLVREAQGIAPATDTAADSIERLKDAFGDMQRESASAFTDEIERVSRFGRVAGEANTTMQSLKSVVTSFAREAAGAMVEAARAVGLLGAVLEYNVARIRHPLDLMNADVRRTEQGVVEAWRRLRATVAGDLSGEDTRDTGLGGSGGVQMANFRFGGNDSANTPNEPGRNRRTSDGGAGAAANARRAKQEQLQREADERRAEQERLQREANERGDREIAESFAAARREADARRAQGIGSPREGGFMGRVLNARDVVGATPLYDATAELAQRNAREAKDREAYQRSDEGLQLRARREEDATREQRTQDRRLASLRSFTSEWESLHQRQVTVAHEAATAGTQALGLFGSALAKHVELLAQGKESAGEAARAFTSELLTNLGHEAIGKGALALADAIAAAATPFTAPMAPGLFAASAAYFAAGATLSGLGAAIAPPAPSVATGGGAASPDGGSRRQASDRRMTDGGGSAPIVVNYYAPVIGGRESTDAELGVRLGRYDDAARARRTRRAA